MVQVIAAGSRLEEDSTSKEVVDAAGPNSE